MNDLEILENLSIKLTQIILPKGSSLLITKKNYSQNTKHDFVLCAPSLITSIKLLINPLYWVPESYAANKWHLHKGDLADFFTFALESVDGIYSQYFNYLSKRKGVKHQLKQKYFTRYFTRQVKEHYEIDPDIYSCFLDEEMVYTCAFFENKDDNLISAQTAKNNVIYERLNVGNKPMKILNIGCGWGSFERFIVKNNDKCNVVGLSISQEQIKWANDRNANVLMDVQKERINLLLEDYLHHTPETKYDAIVSIGMVEHVGLSGYKEYFRKIDSILAKGGRLLVHMIVKGESEIPTNPWIDKYIFPGGYAPSIKEIVGAAEPYNLRVMGVHIHGPENYKRTLRSWRDKLSLNKNIMKNIYKEKYSYDEAQADYMYKQWEVYLAGSEASFSIKKKPQQIAQFVFKKED